MCMHHVCASCPRSPEEGVGTPRTRVMDGFKLSYRYGDENQSPMQEQQVLLTLSHLSVSFSFFNVHFTNRQGLCGKLLF